MGKKRFYYKTNFWLIILVAIIGVAQMLRMSDIPVREISRQYWPLLFVFTAIFQLISNRYRDLSYSIILLLIGLILLLFNIGVLTPDVLRTYWKQSLKHLLGPILQGNSILTGWFKFFIGV